MSNEEKETNELKNLLSGLASTQEVEGEILPSSTIELTHEIVEALFEESKIKMITDLSELEIKGILKLNLLNEVVFDGRKSILTFLTNEVMLLKVSKNRGGRREMIKAIFSQGNNDYEESTSRFKRFLS